MVREQPTLTGPLQIGNLRCGEVAVADLAARVDVTFGAALDRWQGRASLGSGAIRHPVLAAAAIDGQIDFSGTPKGTQGRMEVAARNVVARVGRAERAMVAGRYLIGAATRFDGQAQLGGAQASAAALAPVLKAGEAAAGTPVGPVLRAMTQAVGRAGRRFAADMALAIDSDRGHAGRASRCACRA
ncbi:hypothetical protein GCM10020258_06900 [Sphingomonas yabuuchiae]